VVTGVEVSGVRVQEDTAGLRPGVPEAIDLHDFKAPDRQSPLSRGVDKARGWLRSRARRG